MPSQKQAQKKDAAIAAQLQSLKAMKNRNKSSLLRFLLAYIHLSQKNLSESDNQHRWQKSTTTYLFIRSAPHTYPIVQFMLQPYHSVFFFFPSIELTSVIFHCAWGMMMMMNSERGCDVWFSRSGFLYLL